MFWTTRSLWATILTKTPLVPTDLETGSARDHWFNTPGHLRIDLCTRTDYPTLVPAIKQDSAPGPQIAPIINRAGLLPAFH